MATLSTDKISPKHSKEMAQLKKSRSKGFLRVVIFLVLAIVAVSFLKTVLSDASVEKTNFERIQRELSQVGGTWARELVETQISYTDWLRHHGYGFEVRVFDHISAVLLQGLLSAVNYEGGGTLGQISISLTFALLRLAFFIISGLRLWLFVLIVATALGKRALHSYIGPDLLGETGNGRFFFSGIRSALENVNSAGAPEQQVTGLACPGKVSEAEARSSRLGELLKSHGADNNTNLSLAAIILFRSNFPAYVALQEESQLLSGYYQGAGLADNAALILERALELHRRYSEGELELELEPLDPPEGKQSAEGYADQLKIELNRVLTWSMRESIGQASAEEVATLVLAYEAGKVMAYAYEGEKWLRRSYFSQLCARSILHSVPAFAREYNYNRRLNIRRALIYGARDSSFGPVHFPVDLFELTRSLRQWVELLMACPHEITSVADDVEMFGIISEAQRSWTEHFLTGVMTSRADAVDEVFAANSNIFFIPLPKLLKLVREVVTESALNRLDELVAVVSQRQKLQAMSVDLNGDQETARQLHLKTVTPLTHQEIRSIAEEHNLKIEDIKQWSSVRQIFNAFGWLGKRVGDYSVPNSSIIYTVFKMPQGSFDANEFGYIGRAGMIVLRASQVEAKFGKSWQARFSQAETARMAENKEDFVTLLKGGSLEPDLIEASFG